MKTLILWVDAFRRDYITKENTPFLYKLSKRYGVGALKPSFGFSQASWFSGVYPNKHGEFSVFNNSKNKIITWPLKLLPKSIRPLAFNMFRYLKGNDFISHYIDLNAMEKFSLTREKYYHHKDALRVKTLFDYFKENNISYLLYYWPLIIEDGKTRLTPFVKGTDMSKVKKFAKLVRKTNHDVYFFHISELDAYGHDYGPKSGKIKIKLREQDFLIERILKKFDLDKDNIVIWSDHGMLEVKGTINLENILPENEKYARLIESTMAKLWFFDEEYKQRILADLKNVKHGHVLSKEEIKNFKVNFKDNENFEEVFLADPGYLICPNVFQKHPIKGAHGYDCSQKGELAFSIINKDFKKQGNMVDMLPTILKLLNINYSKNDFDGISLV